ncbi:GntR family transcriptional regulator [Nocardia anaemiae]|uniref:GntR family transcriptional regulator n=1 Tax=Nocardia anaemiae TaxID=263910 RepID=UPI000A062285|nr:GntR family transcriptional regulator [Nocardia anaemiae]
MAGVDNMVPMPLRVTSAVIAEQLRELILDGSFAPGEQISESQLAARLQMSRGPVREAVQRLAQEGLLVNHRNRGVFVVDLDISDIEDIYRGRRAVEKEAASTVYERGIPAELVDRLQEILQNIAQYMNAGDWKRLAREDLHFHETMVEAAQSPRLSRMFSTLAAETMLCMSAFDARYIRPPTAIEEHQRLLDRLLGGDLPEMLAEIDRHMTDAVDSLTSARRERDGDR